jgi:hypothetical protein
MASISVDGKIYWVGGASSISPVSKDYEFSNKVEIRDVNANNSAYIQLCVPVAGYNAVAIQKNNTISFFPGTGFPNAISNNKFDIYDITSNKWSTGLLQKDITGAAIISVGNIIYVKGGNVNGALTDQVWTLAF